MEFNMFNIKRVKEATMVAKQGCLNGIKVEKAKNTPFKVRKVKEATVVAKQGCLNGIRVKKN